MVPLPKGRPDGLKINRAAESKEPAFLRRLRGEVGGQDSARHERPLARPRKPKTPNEDDDDAPTYVDEDSHDVVSKDEYEALIEKEGSIKPGCETAADTLSDADHKRQEPSASNGASEAATPREHVATIGSSSKRRLAKVIGEEETQPGEQDEVQSKRSQKPKAKRSKKIKLSFDEDARSLDK